VKRDLDANFGEGTPSTEVFLKITQGIDAVGIEMPKVFLG
jgi:hypothetical protein